MRADPCFNAVFLRGGIGADDNGATSVVLRDPGDELRISLKRTRRFAVNGEIDERRARHGARAFRPKLFQLPVDLADLNSEAERVIFSSCRHKLKSVVILSEESLLRV